MANDPFKNFKPLNSTPAKKSSSRVTNNSNFVESIREVGGSVVKSIKNDVVKGTAKSIFEQLLGSAKSGQAPDMQSPQSTEDLEAFVAEREAAAAEEAKTSERAFQTHKQAESRVLFSLADEKLKHEIDDVRAELQAVAASMDKVEQAVEQAIIENVVDPGVYHLNFFRKVKAWLVFMRKSLNDGAAWLELSAGRGKQKSYFWGKSEKHGTSWSQSSERNVVLGAG